MSDRDSLIDTLRQTYDRMRDIRKNVASAKHIEAMLEIDTLLGIAEEIALRQLKLIEITRDVTAR